MQQLTEDLGNGVILELVAIPADAFFMGSLEHLGYADEHPRHRVWVNSYYMGKYPVTQEQWQAVMGSAPSCRFHGAKLPVERVSWHDACKFCERLSKMTGHHHRLPGEAEWEYACRAGTDTSYSFGMTITTDQANYVGEYAPPPAVPAVAKLEQQHQAAQPEGIYRHTTTAVDSFPPNGFGLHDMHGNVWEWCADAWHDDYSGAPQDGSAWVSGNSSYRVARGGSWHEVAGHCRSACRLKFDPREADEFVGFRVAADALEEKGGSESVITGSIPLTPIERIRRWIGGRFRSSRS